MEARVFTSARWTYENRPKLVYGALLGNGGGDRVLGLALERCNLLVQLRNQRLEVLEFF